MDFSKQSEIFIIAVGVCSCLLITKDEFVHSREKIPAMEAWSGTFSEFLQVRSIFELTCLASVLFLFYQVGYWNVWIRNLR